MFSIASLVMGILSIVFGAACIGVSSRLCIDGYCYIIPYANPFIMDPEVVVSAVALGMASGGLSVLTGILTILWCFIGPLKEAGVVRGIIMVLFVLVVLSSAASLSLFIFSLALEYVRTFDLYYPNFVVACVMQGALCIVAICSSAIVACAGGTGCCGCCDSYED